MYTFHTSVKEITSSRSPLVQSGEPDTDRIKTESNRIKNWTELRMRGRATAFETIPGNPGTDRGEIVIKTDHYPTEPEPNRQCAWHTDVGSSTLQKQIRTTRTESKPNQIESNLNLKIVFQPSTSILSWHSDGLGLDGLFTRL